MPTEIKGQPTSKEVIDFLQKKNKPVFLSFSCGKDSIATWCVLKDAGIEVIPCYMEPVPGLPFIQDELDYFEEVFNQPIHQCVHPSFWRLLGNAVYQPPERLAILEELNLQQPSFESYWKAIKEDFEMSPNTFVCDGVRASDSIVRRASFVKHGVIKPHLGKVSPIADYLQQEVYDTIEEHGIELPIDYELFGRSFDGIDKRFSLPIKQHLPEDFKVLKNWFPLLEVDILRWEKYGR